MKVEKSKKRADYANYVRNRNSQIFNEINTRELQKAINAKENNKKVRELFEVIF